MRLFYTLLFYLLIPFVLLRLFIRGFKAPEYRKRWQERLAIYNVPPPDSVIWIHAVSVGEVEAVFPLVKQLQTQFPEDKFLVTTTTPTGSQRVKVVLSKSVFHVYLPYDLPCVVKRFISTFNPKIAIIMEKEIWPNLYVACEKNHIPLMIINARLSAKSAIGYKKISKLVRPVLNTIAWVATQTIEDKGRFIDIGVNRSKISVTGNLKFDMALSEGIVQQANNIKKQLFTDRFVWVIASTHDKEEKVFFDLYPVLKKQIPELLLMVVPRHPERFSIVQKEAESLQLRTCMRSTKQQCSLDTDIYIADTMGELKLLYGVADICFVGGSMVNVGGHNILEPAIMGTPIMFGPYMVNFKEISKDMLELSAAIQCANKQAVMDTVMYLYKDISYRADMASRAKEFVNNSQGATETTKKIIIQQIALGMKNK